MIKLNIRTNTTFLLVVAFGVIGVLLASRGNSVSVSKASTTAGGASEPAATGYHKPTGAELTPESAANTAIKDVAEDATSGPITLRVAHGSFARARAVLNGSEGVAGPTSSGQSSCFPGLPCTASEVEQHAREQQELDESSAYLVEMKGVSFSPPAGRLRKGQAPISARTESVIVDAHTGFPEERTIGGEPPKLEQLGPVTELTATIPGSASGEAIATVARRRSTARRSMGAISGLVAGIPHKGQISVILSEGNERVSLRDVHVVRRTKTSSRGTFEIANLLPGRYSLGANGPNCPGKKITVKAGKTTRLILTCTR